MAAIESIHDQHRDILRIASELSRALTQERIRKEPATVRSLLSRLSAKLSIHLNMEEGSLYPALAGSADKCVRATAMRFLRETEGLKDALSAYSRRWDTVDSIQADAFRFMQESKGLFYALAKRLDREDTELYPLLEGRAA